ncbi:MAG: hypothetical protein RLN90_11650 [Balneolaceae bacterium]
MRYSLLLIHFLFLLYTDFAWSQPKTIEELPKEIQNYFESNFEEYSFSRDLIKSDRKIQKNELTEQFLSLPEQSHYFLEGDLMLMESKIIY